MHAARRPARAGPRRRAARDESISLQPSQGTERGNIIGLGYSAYDGGRTVYAGYAELLAPVLKQVELSAAVRYDHYSDAGSSTTPKLGIKYTPIRQLALRATYAQGFRAPSPAENGIGGLAAFSTAADPPRCALGIAAACSAANIAIITAPNPALKPEKSDNYTVGLVFEPTSKTSIALDYFDITRKNEINQEHTDARRSRQVTSPATVTRQGPGRRSRADHCRARAVRELVEDPGSRLRPRRQARGSISAARSAS